VAGSRTSLSAMKWDPAANEPPDLARRLALRPRELAECLGVSERALRQLAPELPRVCRRGLVLYPVDAIREWLRREARAEGDAIKALVADTLASLSGD
jgi:hypothetical protein